MMTLENPYGIGKPRAGRWSLSRDHCRRCKRNDRPHKAKGICNVCYQVEWFRLKRVQKLQKKEKSRDFN